MFTECLISNWLHQGRGKLRHSRLQMLYFFIRLQCLCNVFKTDFTLVDNKAWDQTTEERTHIWGNDLHPLGLDVGLQTETKRSRPALKWLVEWLTAVWRAAPKSSCLLWFKPETEREIESDLEKQFAWTRCLMNENLQSERRKSTASVGSSQPNQNIWGIFFTLCWAEGSFSISWPCELRGLVSVCLVFLRVTTWLHRTQFKV